MNLLCTLKNDCPDFVSGLGSTIIWLVLLCFVCWLLYVFGRVVWLAHRRLATQADIDRLFKYNSDNSDKLYSLHRRLDQVERDRAAGDKALLRDQNAMAADLKDLKDKLGDPDNGLECEAVPCKGRKRGRWLTAWVPFWP